jgi:hypothetical protein
MILEIIIRLFGAGFSALLVWFLATRYGESVGLAVVVFLLTLLIEDRTHKG